MKLPPVEKQRSRSHSFSWTWLCAFLAAQSDSFQSTTDVEEGIEIDLAPPVESPCNIIIRRPDQELAAKMEDFNLSREALYVLGLVLETPIEALDFLYTPAGESVTRTKLLQYLRKQLGWTPRKVRGVFVELSDYVGGFGE